MSVLKKVWSVFTTLLVILVVILAILLVGVRLVGLQVYTVLSGSMEPTYQTGSLIYVKDVDARTLDTGDVITFMLNEDTIATHRIAGVVPDEEDPNVIRFRTKGDANEFEDATLVHYKNVLGTPVFTIPKLGVFAHFIQNPPGRYYAIAFIAILLLMSFLPDLFDDKDKPPKKKKAKTRDEEPDESLPCAKGGGSAKRRRRDCESPEKPSPVTIPQSASLHSADSPLCTKGPLVSNDAPAPTRRKRPVPQESLPQSAPRTASGPGRDYKSLPASAENMPPAYFARVAPSSEGANPNKPPSDEGRLSPAGRDVAAGDRVGGGGGSPKASRRERIPAAPAEPSRKPPKRKPAKPSQSAAPTALPKGEPSADNRAASSPGRGRVSRPESPAPKAAQEPSYDLDDILAEFHSGDF